MDELQSKVAKIPRFFGKTLVESVVLAVQDADFLV